MSRFQLEDNLDRNFLVSMSGIENNIQIMITLDSSLAAQEHGARPKPGAA